MGELEEAKGSQHSCPLTREQPLCIDVQFWACLFGFLRLFNPFNLRMKLMA